MRTSRVVADERMPDADDDSDGLELEDNCDTSRIMGYRSSDEDDELVMEDNLPDDNDDEDDGPTMEENEPIAEHEEYDEDDGLELEENDASGPQSPTLSAADLKELGNVAFKSGDHVEARRYYSEALAAAVGTATAENAAERAILLSNRAACALKLADWPAAINDCTAVLSMSAASANTRTKALFRRASAFAECGELADARRDLELLPMSDPSAKRLRASLTATSPAAKQPAAPSRERAEQAAVRERNGAGGSARKKRVSCISPTTPERALFHEAVCADRAACHAYGMSACDAPSRAVRHAPSPRADYPLPSSSPPVTTR